ncbi:MAG: ABC transporter ATP-binding protein [Streptococcaceae bacterium]|jgi:ABC-2 type transport system ATP-binding protein|nr:ABC transporter ATP-binding protein [Streptococcaceae bacterium]
MTLSIKNLSGGYFGRPVLKNVNFELADGELAAFVGLNGAGKTTTIKEIMGLLTPFSGEIRVNGVTLKENADAYRKAIGYIPESPSLYDELTLEEHIDLTALSYDIPSDIARARAQKLLQTFRLDDKLDWFPSTFSKGMKQKVMIICAFLTQPSLYIIDEPFMGLDPLAIHDLIDLMQEMRAEGASILMSTHILATAEQFADKFIVLKDGGVVADGNLAALQAQFGAGKSLDDIYMELARPTTGSTARS